MTFKMILEFSCLEVLVAWCVLCFWEEHSEMWNTTQVHFISLHSHTAVTALKCLTLDIFRCYQKIIASNYVFSSCHFHRVGRESGPPRQRMPSERLHAGKPTHYCSHNRNRMLNVGYGTYKDRSDESMNMSFKVWLRDCRVLTDVKTAAVSAKQGQKPNINLEDKSK